MANCDGATGRVVDVVAICVVVNGILADVVANFDGVSGSD